MSANLVEAQGLSIVVPCFNEEQGIGEFLEELEGGMASIGVPYEIIVVDDGSTDGTTEVVLRHDVRVVEHPFNRGYGAAVKTGIRQSRYDFVCIIDGDNTYPVKEIPRLMEYAASHDMVVGARVGPNVAVPWIRKPAKWALNALANFLTGFRIPDLNSGLRVMRRDVMLDFLALCPNGFSFTTTSTIALLTNDYLVRFVPIDYLPRTGKSKIHPIKDTVNFFGLVLRTVTYFAPLKVFIPLSLALLVTGVGLLFYRAFVSTGLTVTIVVIFLAALQLAAVGLLADMIDKRIVPARRFDDRRKNE